MTKEKQTFTGFVGIRPIIAPGTGYLAETSFVCNDIKHIDNIYYPIIIKISYEIESEGE